ncbi:MKRN2 opposite strand protein [Polymixia lowei]
MDRSVIRWSHCQKEMLCFSLPEACPACGEEVKGSRLEEAPVILPPPFSNGHKTSCCLLVAPALDSTSRDFDGTSDLHTGISDTTGMVYNYTRSGVRRDQSGWERCVSIPLVRPDMLNLQAEWNRYLVQFSGSPMWDPIWQRFDEESHNCLSFCLCFLNGVLALQSRPALTRDQLTETFILPRIKRASRYTSLCQLLTKEVYLLLDRRDEEVAED